MSDSLVDPCPSLTELLLAEDRQLPPAAQADVSAHVRHCVTCQMELRREAAMLQAVAGQLARQPTETERRARHDRFMRAVHSHKQERSGHVPAPPIRRWLPMAAVMPVFIAGLLLSRPHEATVRADELLQRAAWHDQERPTGSAQRLRFRLLPRSAAAMTIVTHASYTATQELTDGMTITGSGTFLPAGMPATLAGVLDRHHFNWRQPFTAASFSAMRDTMVHPRDHVSPILSLTGTRLLRLRAISTEGDLREAELIVERDTWHIVSAAFVFEGVGRLEIEELAQWVRRAEPPRVMPASTPAPAIVMAPPDRDAIDIAELEARWMLSQSGDDLRGTVHVSSNRETVRIDGILPSATTRRAIATRFATLPYVRVTLRASSSPSPAEPHDAAGATSTLAASASAAPWISAEPVSGVTPFVERPALSHWADRTLGHETARATFIPEFTTHVTRTREHMAVLAELAQRYRETDVRQLSPVAQATFRTLLNRHYEQLHAHVQALKAQIAVLDRSANLEPASSGTPADWRNRAASGLPRAKALDALVQEVLTLFDLPAEQQRQLGERFTALWQALYAPAPPSHAPERQS